MRTKSIRASLAIRSRQIQKLTQEVNEERKMMTKTLAFLHTAPVNVATFDRLLAEIAPSIPVKHVIDESLLRDARAFGITAELEERIHGALTDLMEDAAVVVCTCSTIGGSAEQT